MTLIRPESLFGVTDMSYAAAFEPSQWRGAVDQVRVNHQSRFAKALQRLAQNFDPDDHPAPVRELRNNNICRSPAVYPGNRTFPGKIQAFFWAWTRS
jgi:hypothetical protein